MTIITREGMEKALQQNYDNEDTEAEHVAQASYVKEYLRTVLAEQVFKAPDDLSGAMKEHWARQTQEYKDIITTTPARSRGVAVEEMALCTPHLR